MNSDVIIVGAGASGLMCASTAARRGRKVVILEHNDRPGAKIRVSGGGHCNFTNRDVTPEHYRSTNPHFCRSALSRFRPEDFLSLVKANRVPYQEREDGQLFCRGPASGIVKMLTDECDRAGVLLDTGLTIQRVERNGNSFSVRTDRATHAAPSLVIATGGLSYPDLGASDLGYRTARQFGLSVVTPEPALVPFTFDAGDLAFMSSLSGVSVPATVRYGRKEFSGNILFTHRGLSGPAVLQASSLWQNGDAVRIDLCPGTDPLGLLMAKRSGRMELATLLSTHLPRRFAQAWCARYATSRPMNHYNDKELGRIADRLRGWELLPSGTEGYRTAEVTRGGVDTRELSSRTMEVTKVPGLFFIGEVVDVTGQLGGYNLHWAWASGAAAGQFA